MFRQILTNPNHVLAHLLPEKVNTHYQLRPRQHNRQLIPKTTKLYTAATLLFECYTNIHIDFYFIVHSLTVLITFILLLSYIVQVAFCQFDIKRR